MKLNFIEVPQEVVDSVQPLLERYGPIVRDAVETFHIQFCEDSMIEGDEFFAATSVKREYRSATIYIAPAWLRLPQDAREEVMAHEVCHVLTMPLRRAFTSLLEHFFSSDEDALSSYVRERYEEADEEVVDSLAKVFVDLKAQRG